MKSLVQGVGYARQMRKNPGFKAMAVLILATHIGSTKAIFTHDECGDDAAASGTEIARACAADVR